MDRFIAKPLLCIFGNSESLKSNMDRFIAKSYTQPTIFQNALKSNMDRFIGPTKFLVGR